MSETATNQKDRFERFLDKRVEPAYFALRYVTLIPVVFSFVGAILMFGIGAVETYHSVAGLLAPHDATHVATTADGATLGHQELDDRIQGSQITLIRSVDAFLLGLVLMIFSYGIYDLFVSHLDPADRPGVRPNWLNFHDITSLKITLAEVVLIILIITFFELVVTNADSFAGSDGEWSAWRFLVIPIGVLLIAVGLGVFHRLVGKQHRPDSEGNH